MAFPEEDLGNTNPIITLKLVSQKGPIQIGLRCFNKKKCTSTIKKIARRTTGAKDFYLVQGIDTP
jgi:hypothetical protein